MSPLYQQCELQRGDERQVAWLLQQFCKARKILKLKVDGHWEDGWRVHVVYSETLTQEQVNARELRIANPAKLPQHFCQLK